MYTAAFYLSQAIRFYLAMKKSETTVVTLQALHISNRSITAARGVSTTPAEIHAERGIETEPETKRVNGIR